MMLSEIGINFKFCQIIDETAEKAIEAVRDFIDAHVWSSSGKHIVY
jgi:hypothetical protein